MTPLKIFARLRTAGTLMTELDPVRIYTAEDIYTNPFQHLFWGLPLVVLEIFLLVNLESLSNFKSLCFLKVVVLFQ